MVAQDKQAALNAEMAKLQAEVQADTIRRLASMCAELRVEVSELKEQLASKEAGK